MRKRKSNKDIHHVTVEVNEDNLLKRAGILHTAAYKIIQGTRLVRFISSDYEAGKFEFLIEADDVKPTIVPATVTVTVDNEVASSPAT